MRVIARDNSPDISPGCGIELLGNGFVRADVDDARHEELRDFFGRNPQLIRGQGGGSAWGRTGANDATEAESFAIGQLTYLEQKAFARWYAPMRYEEVLVNGGIDYSAGPQAKQVDYLISDGVGVGGFISPAGTNVPMVDVAYAKTTIGVGLGGIGYDYTDEDLRTSAFLRQPLSNTKQVEAVLAYKRHANRVALIGDVPKGFKGLYNNASVTAAPTTSAANWNAATADTIVADIIAAYSAYIAATADNMKPSVIIFPLTSYNLLYKPRSTVSDTTISKFIQDTLNVKIMSDPLLETLGSGTSTKRVVLANPENDNMVYHIPMPLQFKAPLIDGFRVVVLGSYKLGGFEVRRVQTARYMDGV